MCSFRTKHQPSLSNSLIITISKFQIMKKTYIIPAIFAVELGTCKMMAESLPVGDGTIENPDDILTKENKDVNIWDEEW